MLLGKYIPMEMLAQMPLPFVHRLRDKRIKQLEEKQRNQESLAAKMKFPATTSNNTSNTPPSPPHGLDGDIDESDLEELFGDI
jgi:hypothetical protein